MPEPEYDPGGWLKRVSQAGPPDGIDDAWSEPGSDELMDFDVLVRIRTEADLVEISRARKIARRAE